MNELFILVGDEIINNMFDCFLRKSTILFMIQQNALWIRKVLTHLNNVSIRDEAHECTISPCAKNLRF